MAGDSFAATGALDEGPFPSLDPPSRRSGSEEYHDRREHPPSSDIVVLVNKGEHIEVQCLLCKSQTIGTLSARVALNAAINAWNDHCADVRRRK